MEDAAAPAGGAGTAAGSAAAVPAAGGIQALVDSAAPGATVKLPAGDFGGLIVKKQITLIGAPGKKTILSGLLDLHGGSASKPLRVEGLNCCAGINVASTANVVLSGLTVTNPGRTGIMTASGATVSVVKTVISDCEDGMINSARLLVDGCTIDNCDADGIFSNPCFTIKDSTITDVGRHGIKSRGGTVRQGRNNIQASPWDAF